MGFCKAFILMALIMSPAHLWAQDRRLPQITHHSDNLGLEARVGDKMVLEAKVEGKNLKFQWVNRDRVICQTLQCTLDLAGFSLGYHNIVFVARNQEGSSSVTFKVRVRTRESGRKAETITPKLVEGRATSESLRADDFYIHARKGLSFVYRKDRRIQILGVLPRKLEWAERFRSSGGVLQFGKLGQEEHSLMPGSYARLETRGGRRVIALEDGMARLRNISGAVPEWSVVAGDWLQVDGDAKADFVVNVGRSKKNQKAPVARIVALRGQVRAIYREGATLPVKGEDAKQPADAEATYKEVVIPPGTTILINPTLTETPEPHLPPFLLSRKVIQATTPIYLQPAAWPAFLEKDAGQKEVVTETEDEADVGPTPDNSAYEDVVILKRSERQKQVDEALKAARKAYDDRDYLLVLEHLLPLHVKEKGRYELNLYLGMAYKALRLHSFAQLFLKEAKKLKPQEPEPSYQLGLLAVEFRKWENAVDHLDDAEASGYSNRQAIDYYRGIAYKRLGRDYRSRENLSRSLWDDRDEAISTSSRQILREADLGKTWGARGRFALLSDSNIFRKANSEDSPKGIGPSSGMGLSFDMDAMIRAYYTEQGSFGFGFDFSYLSWFNQELKEVDSASQKFHVDFGFKLGDTAKPSVTFDSQIYLRTIVVGGQRSVDGLGILLNTELSSVAMTPEIYIESAMYVDPMPNRDDGIDPFLGEVVFPTDRSARYLAYGLGGTVMKTPSSQAKARLKLASVSHTTALIEVDDFKETELEGTYDLQYTNRLEFGGLGQYTLRTFPKATDNRKDSTIHLKGNARWYQTPFLSYDGWLGTTFQSSNRSANKYTRFVLGVGAALEL